LPSAGSWPLCATASSFFIRTQSGDPRAAGEVESLPFSETPGSRHSLFLELDQPALRSLPEQRFDLAAWSRATVNIDYHIQFDHGL
jgi:hypothetical protein